MISSNFKVISLGLVLLALVNFGSSAPADPTTPAPAVTPTHPATAAPVTQPPVTPGPTVPTTPAITTPTGTTVTPFPAFGVFCKGHKTGDYVVDPTDPHVYYQCMVGRAIKFTCPNSALQGKLIFDVVKQVCVFPPEV